MKNLTILDWISLIILSVGGLNWGLIGLFNFDLVATLFGNFSLLSRLVYLLVGISAIYSLFSLPNKKEEFTLSECENLIKKSRSLSA